MLIGVGQSSLAFIYRSVLLLSIQGTVSVSRNWIQNSVYNVQRLNRIACYYEGTIRCAIDIKNYKSSIGYHNQRHAKLVQVSTLELQ